MLTIFRGDDLAFGESDRKVCVKFNTCLDLTGWKAVFYLLDTVKSTNDISSRLWTFGYTADETQNFPLGKTFGKLVVTDQSGQIRQMCKVEVEVVNKAVEPCLCGSIAISVDSVIADYANLANKPVLNDKIIDGVHDASYYSLASSEELAALSQRVDDLDHTVGSVISALTERISNEEETRAQEVGAINTRIDSIISGSVPISKLLFEAEGDTDNYYRIQVVMRDDGAGNMLPALALDAVPRT